MPYHPILFLWIHLYNRKFPWYGFYHIVVYREQSRTYKMQVGQSWNHCHLPALAEMLLSV